MHSVSESVFNNTSKIKVGYLSHAMTKSMLNNY